MRRTAARDQGGTLAQPGAKGTLAMQAPAQFVGIILNKLEFSDVSDHQRRRGRAPIPTPGRFYKKRMESG